METSIVSILPDLSLRQASSVESFAVEIKRVLPLIKKLSKSATVILSTHIINHKHNIKIHNIIIS